MDGLTFFDVENVAVTTALDLGTAAPASSDDTQLRVFNTNSAYQAEDVTVAVDGGDAIQLWLSSDGDNFEPAIEIGDIPPNGTSPVFWLRRVTASTTAGGPCTAHLTATPAGWTHPLDTSTSPNTAIETGD